MSSDAVSTVFFGSTYVLCGEAKLIGLEAAIVTVDRVGSECRHFKPWCLQEVCNVNVMWRVATVRGGWGPLPQLPGQRRPRGLRRPRAARGQWEPWSEFVQHPFLSADLTPANARSRGRDRPAIASSPIAVSYRQTAARPAETRWEATEREGV